MLNIYEKIAIFTQIWHRAKFYFMYQRPVVPDHGTQYEESPSIHHGGMCEDRHPDGRLDRLPCALTDWTRSYILRSHLGRTGHNITTQTYQG